MKQWYIYLLANDRNGTLYIGVTNNLSRRVQEHRDEAIASFTSRYHVHTLVYHETFDQPREAIRREKNLKAWKRLWKIQLIESVNPQWEDLASALLA